MKKKLFLLLSCIATLFSSSLLFADNLFIANFENLSGFLYGEFDTLPTSGGNLTFVSNAAAYGNSGKSIVLNYNLTTGPKSEFWITFTSSSVNLNNYNYLSFRLKGVSSNQILTLQMQPSDMGPYSDEVDLRNFLPGGKTSTNFQKLVVPLTAFKGVGYNPTLGNTLHIAIKSNDQIVKTGKIIIDEIMFGTGTLPIFIDNMEIVETPADLTTMGLVIADEGGTDAAPRFHSTIRILTNDSFAGKHSYFLSQILGFAGTTIGWSWAQNTWNLAPGSGSYLDASGCDTFKFAQKKGAQFQGTEHLYLASGLSTAKFIDLGSILTSTWQEKNIPLSSFSAQGVDLSQLVQLRITHEGDVGPNNWTNSLFVDEMRFVDTTPPTVPFNLSANGSPINNNGYFSNKNLVITFNEDSKTTDKSIENVTLQYSTNNGATWIQLSRDYGIKTIYTNIWNASALSILGTYQIRVIAMDSSGNESTNLKTGLKFDLTRPNFTNFSPINGQSGVPTNSNIFFEVQDNQQINSNSIFAQVNSITVLSNGLFKNAFTGSNKSNGAGGYKIQLDKSGPFPDSSTIQVFISAKDQAQFSISTNYSFTVPDTTAPLVAVLPTNNATNISLNQHISIAIGDSIAVDTNSISIRIDGLSAFTNHTFTNNYSGSTTAPNPTMFYIFLTPTVNFSTNQTVNIQITAQDSTGNQVLKTCSFTTKKDLIKPVFTNWSPAKGQTHVQTNTSISFIVFDDLGVYSNSIFVKIGGSTALTDGGFKPNYSGSISNTLNGYKVFINPVNNFITNQIVTIQASCRDIVNKISTNTFTFTTISIDTQAPSLNANRPSGTYVGSVTLVIGASDDSGTALIYYTLDGNKPSIASSCRTNSLSLTINKDTTVKYFSQDLYENSTTNTFGFQTLTFHILKAPDKDVVVYQNFLDLSKPGQTMNIVFSKDDNAEINIYNTKGDLVRKFAKKIHPASTFESWDGKNDNDQKLGSGMYIIHIKGDKINSKLKVLIVK